jgi:hypothetical protein
VTVAAASSRLAREASRTIPAAEMPVVVVGTPFSGATTLAWALGQHPDLLPLVGAGTTDRLVSALRVVDEDLLPLLTRVGDRVPPLRSRFAGSLGWVMSAPNITERLDTLLRLLPELLLIHVERRAEAVVPQLVAAARRDGTPMSNRRAKAIWSRRLGECLAAEELVAADRVLRLGYDVLAERPEEAVSRCLALLGKRTDANCLWPLRLLTSQPSHTPLLPPAAPPGRCVAAHPARLDARLDPRNRTLRRLVEAVVPDGARVLVVSRGDETLLSFRRRSGLHFPQLDDGTWAGFYPDDGDTAVAHLQELAASGASHVVFPKPALWWLDHYPELREQLEGSGRLIAWDPDVAAVWELAKADRLILPRTLRASGATPVEPDNARAFSIDGRDTPPRRRRALGGSLWAMTTFYNPEGYRTKRENYDRFRSGLAAADVPLLTLELAFGDAPYELAQSDAELLVQLRGHDVLWQKERLLNLGVQRLPDSCDKVAWLDADVLFARTDWARETARLLASYVSVQPFSHSVRLPAQSLRCEPAMLPFGAGESELFYGIAWGVRAKGRVSLASYDQHGHTGFAWAARRSLLDEHGLYDANLLGNGDTDIAHAMFGSTDYWALQKLGVKAQAHLAQWARPFAAAVGGSVAHVDGVVSHLWHGETQHRLYDRPLDVLHGFDPERDLVTSADGLLRFTDEASPELRAWSHAYFAARREDG